MTETSKKSSTTLLHALMLPYPLQGHVIPFVNLATKLASQYGFTITFINTESVHHQISKARINTINEDEDDIFTESRRSGLDIRYETVGDGFPLEFDRSLNHDEFFEVIMHDFVNNVDQLVGRLIREDPTINCLIVDTFYVWPSVIADKYNLANISFFTEPALVFTLYYHLELLVKNGHFGSKENRTDAIDYIPGVKPIKPTDLMSYLQAKNNIKTTVHRILYKAFEDVKKAGFIICNTIQELEEQTISALNQKQPFYAIGPIFPPNFTKNRICTSLWSESDCTQWLDTKPQGSVLYVSFGSYAHTSKQEIVELANGLMLSEVNFIWVLRPDIVSSDETDILPDGFADKVAGRGLIVMWCSQIEVLSHKAVGGFLTHCGWNSILESVWCGVPLICYPLLTDQFTNRKLVVDDLKIGINLYDDDDEEEKKLKREVVCDRIRSLMNKGTNDDDDQGSKEIKGRVAVVRKMMEEAMEMNGSSSMNFDRFVKDLMNEVCKRRGVVVENGGHVVENGNN